LLQSTYYKNYYWTYPFSPCLWGIVKLLKKENSH